MLKIEVPFRNRIVEIGVYSLLTKLDTSDLSRVYSTIYTYNLPTKMHMTFSKRLYDNFICDHELITILHKVLCSGIVSGDVNTCNIVYKLIKALNPKVIKTFINVLEDSRIESVLGEIFTQDIHNEFMLHTDVRNTALLYMCYLVKKLTVPTFLVNMLVESEYTFNIAYKRITNDYKIKLLQPEVTLSEITQDEYDQVVKDIHGDKSQGTKLISKAVRVLNSAPTSGHVLSASFYAFFDIDPDTEKIKLSFTLYRGMIYARRIIDEQINSKRKRKVKIEFKDYYLLGMLIAYDLKINESFKSMLFTKKEVNDAIDEIMENIPNANEDLEKKHAEEVKSLQKEVERLKTKAVKYDELIAKYSDVRGEIDKWKTKYHTLNESITANENIKSAYETLKDKYSTLKEENARLADEVNILKESQTQQLMNEEVDLDELVDNIKDFKILVIGGHDKTTIRLKKLFSSWTFIDCEKFASADENMVKTHDMLVILSDYNAHKCTMKFSIVAERQNIPKLVTRSTNTKLVCKDINDFLKF